MGTPTGQTPGRFRPAALTQPTTKKTTMSYLHVGQDLAFAQATVPAFRFPECDTGGTGCGPHAANACRAIVRRAIRNAIWLADNAASKLSARDKEAVGLFRAFFGDPSRPVPWASNRQAADLVAERFRAVSEGFRKRVPHVRCATAADSCGAFAAFVVPRRRQLPSFHSRVIPLSCALRSGPRTRSTVRPRCSTKCCTCFSGVLWSPGKLAAAGRPRGAAARQLVLLARVRAPPSQAWRPCHYAKPLH